MKTAITFLAFMIKNPTAPLQTLIKMFNKLPVTEKEKVSEAFSAVYKETE